LAPVTPYQRILASDAIPESVRRKIASMHQTLNPFDLKRRIEAKLNTIFSMVSVTSNVRQRL
jgi:hypothetical protein